MHRIKELSKQPIAKYILLFITIFISFVIFRQNTFHTFDESKVLINLFSEETIKGIMIICLMSVTGYAAYEGYNKRLTPERVITLLTIAGLIMRIGYCMYTPSNVRQHDLGDMFTYDPENFTHHHSGYIYWFYTNFGMPETNFGQFYHPPFFHWCAGMLMRLAGLFSDNHTAIFGFSMVISCFASCMILFISRNILSELKFSPNAQIPVMALISFFPALILVSGYINNESLGFMFTMLCVLYTIRWVNKRDTRSIIGLALSFGFGIMTKMSVALFAIPTGIVMLLKLIEAIRNKEVVKYIKQYSIFAAISLPLGMWFHIRNLIRFGQPLGYVHAPPRDPDVAATLFQRLFPLPIGSPEVSFSSPFSAVGKESNLWLMMNKTAMFGEFGFNSKFLASILLIVNALLVILSIISIISVLKNNKSLHLLYLAFTATLTIINYAVFYIKLPYACSANFRYILITAVIGAIFIVNCMQNKDSSKTAMLVYRCALALVPIFCLLSIAIYA